MASDANPNAPGFDLADQAVVASVYDPAETVREARAHHAKRPVDGVLCIAVDATRTVAAVAAALGLPALSPEAVGLVTDKLAMKERLEKEGIPIPWFAPVRNVSELRVLAAERGFQLVLKPIDSRGARGVLRLTAQVDLDWAFEHARSYSGSDVLLLEEFVPGPQISTESILFDGRAFTPGLADRNYDRLEAFAPHVVEDGGELPSHLSEADRAACRQVAEAAARALGVERGIAKGDLVRRPRGAVVIEVAGRLSGGWFSTLEIPLSTGVDLVGAAIRLALGEQPAPRDLIPDREVHLAQRYLFAKPGTVVSIDGVEAVGARPSIEFVHLNVQMGDRVAPITDHTGRAGVVIASGRTREEAIREASGAVDDVRIETAGGA